MRRLDLKGFTLRSEGTKGWTLAELLIAVAVIGILALFVWLGVRTQIARGYDARRKADLDLIRKAFEEYYNDNGCYPAAGILDNCGGGELRPYIDKIPCDPTTGIAYGYFPEGNPCLGFRACVSLQDKGDPAIGALGCNPDTGCGWGEGLNYCGGSGVPVVAAGFDPSATPTPPGGGGAQPTATPTPTPGGGGGATPTPTPGGGGGPGPYACTPGGDCNIYADPDANGCPVTFADPSCDNRCSDPANRCAS